MEKNRAAIYVRCSTTHKTHKGDKQSYEQNPDVQERPLRDLLTQRGWQLIRIYLDRASGAKERRPGLDELMRDARRGAFDVVVVFRFDRFARSVKQLVLALEEFHLLGLDFVSYSESLDTSTPIGFAMFTIIGAMAELERSIIRERVIAGLAHAKLQGTKSGKPIGRPRVVFHRDRVADLRSTGLSWREIASRLGASIGTVRRAASQQRVKSEPAKTPPKEIL